MIAIVFTHSYPYNYHAEHVFVGRELPSLVKQIDKVILVPRRCKGEQLAVPPGADVENGYADFLEKHSRPINWLKLGLTSGYFIREVMEKPEILFYPSKLLMLILFIARAELTRHWTLEYIRRCQLNARNSLLYSYWFDHVTLGLGLLKREFPDLKVVSRAHGYDIYEEFYYPYYWPCRRDVISLVDRIFTSSDAGRTYLADHFSEFGHKFETAYLGVPGTSIKPRLSSDGVLRIVSCSFILPVKRLDLLMEGVVAAARSRPGQRIEWIHIGDGKKRKELDRKTQKSLPGNAAARFMGHLPNEEVLQYYRNNPVDVFINLSLTEGGAPVSIMEAISCGIPVVATRVGGNPEIVSDRNGILLSENPLPEEIAAALFTFIDNPGRAAQWRIGSRMVWQEKFNSLKNFEAFARRLKTIGGPQ
jgi:glycosyltransferase involved in cell wall biosynthesis